MSDSILGSIFGSGHSIPMMRALHMSHFAQERQLGLGEQNNSANNVVRSVISCISLFVSSKIPMFPRSLTMNQGWKLVMHLQMKSEAAVRM